MKGKLCTYCSTPLYFQKNMEWNANGTMYLKGDISHRMVILDCKALNNSMVQLEQRVGVPITDAIVRAKAAAANRYINTVLSGPLGWLSRSFSTIKVYEKIAEQALYLGYGVVRFTEYMRRVRLEGQVINPYLPMMMAGDIAGTFSSVERKPGRIRFEVEDGLMTFEIDQDQRFGEMLRARLKPQTPSIPAISSYRRCPECGVPILLSRFKWNLAEGLIYDVKTARRTAIIGMETIQSLYDDLEERLGPEVPIYVMEIEKERVRKDLEKRDLIATAEGYRRLLAQLRVRGMGEVAGVQKAGTQLRVRVNNPYSVPAIVALVSGAYEALNQIDSKESWRIDPRGFLDITVEPK